MVRQNDPLTAPALDHICSNIYSWSISFWDIFSMSIYENQFSLEIHKNHNVKSVYC